MTTVRQAVLEELTEFDQLHPGDWLSVVTLTRRVRVRCDSPDLLESNVTRRARELREPKHGGHHVRQENGHTRFTEANTFRWIAENNDAEPGLTPLQLAEQSLYRWVDRNREIILGANSTLLRYFAQDIANINAPRRVDDDDQETFL